MKKIIIIAAAISILNSQFSILNSQEQPTEQMMREFRQTVQKRDISKRHLESDIPLSDKAAEAYPLLYSDTKGIPDERLWFPGEWEEVKAIVVTPYYSYAPATSQGSGYWMADPLVTGVADYYKYSAMGWQQQGTGPYTSTMDTNSTFGKVFFYLMDGIQLGGAEAWVRVEKPEDTAKVIRTLSRLNLRHNNVRFLIGSGNSFWYRDCGPICFYSGDNDEVAMLDFTYYPGRALDDSLPSHIHHQMGIPNYMTKVEWEGGNCLVDGAGMVVSSDAIYSNNADGYGQLTWDGHNVNTINYTSVPRLSKAQVKQALHDLLGQRATYILPAYQYDGGTGHIDLYADAWDENGFVFSIMPNDYSSWVDYVTGMKNIDSLCSYKSIFDRNYYMMGFIPFPSRDNGSNFASQNEYNNNYTRTYSNHTFVNNVILQPCFSAVVNGQPSAQWDRDNLEVLQTAYPGYTIYPVDVREFDGSGGAIHCVTKQIPADNPVRILHKVIHGNCDAMRNSNIPVSAIITNKSGIAHAEVHYRLNGGDWQTLNLTANGNRFYNAFPFADETATIVNVDYYISATSNNGKTITKPMTALQGGYYSFQFSNEPIEEEVDSTQYDFDTLPMPMENITFTFGTDWATEDNSQPWQPHVAIDQVELYNNFGQFYPNPAADQANIKIDLANGQHYDVTIVDINGRTVHTSTLQAAGQVVFTINASRLAAGVYHVIFSSNDNRVVRQLIVK